MAGIEPASNVLFASEDTTMPLSPWPSLTGLTLSYWWNIQLSVAPQLLRRAAPSGSRWLVYSGKCRNCGTAEVDLEYVVVYRRLVVKEIPLRSPQSARPTLSKPGIPITCNIPCMIRISRGFGRLMRSIPDRNRTCIEGFVGLRRIRWTTETSGGLTIRQSSGLRATIPTATFGRPIFARAGTSVGLGASAASPYCVSLGRFELPRPTFGRWCRIRWATERLENLDEHDD